jgi:transcriptional regulator with AAA-type ATPase domain
MQWMADRFFYANGSWIDAASGSRVRVLIEDADPEDALEWDEQCARMANVRHPLLNPLIDYGLASNARRFEAYAIAGNAAAAGGSGERALAHVAEFLAASGIAPTSARCRLAIRPVSPEKTRSGRAVGITLQPRRALSAVHEALGVASRSGPSALTVSGPPHAGLRTLRTFIARAARLHGFVPVCGELLASGRLGPLPRERHICLLDDAIGQGRRGDEIARHLIEMARASTRAHVLIRFERGRSGRASIPLEPMSVRSLVGMVFAGKIDPVGENELFAAAREAAGRPGDFVARLGGAGFDRRPAPVMSVHETPHEYLVTPRADAEAPRPARPTRWVAGALPRAATLAGRRRYAAALRVLDRAARVLAGRRQDEASAECLVAAGHLVLARGRTAEAAGLFDDARKRSRAGMAAFRAAAGLAESWIEEARLAEAEVLLRGTLTAADALEEPRVASGVHAVLVRALFHQRRYAEALAIAGNREWTDGSDESGALLAIAARCHAAAGRISPALRLARASESAAANQHPAQVARAALALAEVLAAAGDLDGMRAELRAAMTAARAAHLPLVLLEARVLAAERLESAPGARERRRVLRLLARGSRVTLPRLLRQRIEQIAAGDGSGPVGQGSEPLAAPAPDPRGEAADALEHLLQACQGAPDDSGAVAAVCAAAVRRLGAASVQVLSAAERRVLAIEGRPWVAHSTVAAQSLATGMPTATEAGCEPREAAAPVRYGGDIVAVLAARWTAGAPVDGYGAAAFLHAAALAVAAPVRAVLDRLVPHAPPGAWSDLLGESPAAATLREAVTRAARAPFAVLIEGESGSGKELVARAIHRLGPRRDRRFCAINCAALTDELVEAELFGHAKGAFTGAATERPGLFEEADGGTLFLDEVGELSARAQAKLLRVLQEGEVRRVGENFSRRIDARVVAATNRRLEEEVAAGRFRSDLRFRLDVIRISVPPLRERPGDIPLLAARFWNDASTRVGSRATLSGDALAALARHDWPGNVRELQNVVAWMAVHSPPRGRIGASALPSHVAGATTPASGHIEAARDEFERRFIRAALAGANGQRAKAAQALGITRQGLAKMMRRLRIEAPP